MVCDLCKQNVATVHLTQMIDGKTKKIDLCETCSKAKGVDDPTGFSLADLLLGLGAAQEMEQASGGGDLRCPHCGFTQSDFRKSGRLGCAQCYDTFADGLETLLKTMHKSTRHVGKVPAVLKKSQDLNDRLRTLEKKLQKAVADEDFELAVNLRDEIKEMKGRLNEMTIGDV